MASLINFCVWGRRNVSTFRRQWCFYAKIIPFPSKNCLSLPLNFSTQFPWSLMNSAVFKCFECFVLEFDTNFVGLMFLFYGVQNNFFGLCRELCDRALSPCISRSKRLLASTVFFAKKWFFFYIKKNKNVWYPQPNRILLTDFQWLRIVLSYNVLSYIIGHYG